MEFVKSILGMGLYWDRLNIIQLQALPWISSCLLIQPPPPDDFLQHTFGIDNTKNISSVFFNFKNVIYVENPLLIQPSHAGEFSQHTCHWNDKYAFVLHLFVCLLHLLCFFCNCLSVCLLISFFSSIFWWLWRRLWIVSCKFLGGVSWVDLSCIND